MFECAREELLRLMELCASQLLSDFIMREGSEPDMADVARRIARLNDLLKEIQGR